MTIGLKRSSRVDEMGTIIFGEVADVGLQDLLPYSEHLLDHSHPSIIRWLPRRDPRMP